MSAGEKSDQLNLKVVGQDGQVIQFKIKESTPFRKLMNAYCERQKLVMSTIRFVFDGTRLKETDTPKSLEMEDDDTIEVFSQQTGGSASKQCLIAHSAPYLCIFFLLLFLN